MNKVCLEVALNGPWSRSLQPALPISVEELVREGIACANSIGDHNPAVQYFSGSSACPGTKL